MTDLDLAKLAAAAYTAAPSFAAGGVHTVLAGDVLAARGTACAADVVRDIDAIPVHDRDLGWCHRGFRDGARSVFAAVLAGVPDGVTLAGHSLGGALAILLAGLLVMQGRHVPRLVTFGAPRAGGYFLRTLMSATQVTQYRHDDDPVTEIPFLPGVFEHLVGLTQVGHGDRGVADHPIAAYIAALAA